MSFKSNLTLALGRATLKFKDASPTIAVAGGIVGLGATVVLASRATLKAQDVVQKHKDEIKVLDEAYEIGSGKIDEETGEEIYSAKDYAQDNAMRWVGSAVAMLKLYGPAIIVGGLSVAAILGGHKAMGTRLAAMSGAVGVLERTLDNYREHMADELGEDVEKEAYAESQKKAVAKDKQEEVDAQHAGKKAEKKSYSTFARFFDEASTRWTRNPRENRLFLSNAQNYFNDLLLARGHVFLNEVYDHLGFDRVPEGQMLGWMYTGDEGSNNYVDFGIFESEDWAKRAFVNGDEAVVLLDFNLDGAIANQI